MEIQNEMNEDVAVDDSIVNARMLLRNSSGYETLHPFRWGSQHQATMMLWPTMSESLRQTTAAWSVVWFIYRIANNV